VKCHLKLHIDIDIDQGAAVRDDDSVGMSGRRKGQMSGDEGVASQMLVVV